MKHEITKESVIQFINDALKEIKQSAPLGLNRIKELVNEYYDTILALPRPKEIIIMKSIDNAWGFIQEHLSLEPDIRDIEKNSGTFDLSRRSYSEYKRTEFAISVLKVPIDDGLKQKHAVALELSRIAKLFSFKDVCVVGLYEEISFNEESTMYPMTYFKKMSRSEIANQICKDTYIRRFQNLNGGLYAWLNKYDQDLFHYLLTSIQRPLEKIFSV